MGKLVICVCQRVWQLYSVLISIQHTYQIRSTVNTHRLWTMLTRATNLLKKSPKQMEPLHHIYNSIMHSVPHLFAVSIIGIVIQASSDSMLAGSVSGVWPMLMSHRDTPGHGIEV